MELLEKFVKLAVKRRFLVRIFAVTQWLRQRRGNRQHRRQRIFVGGKFVLQMRRNRAVIGRRARKNFGRKFAAQFQRGVAAFGNLSCHLRVIRRVNHDRDAVVVFRRAAEHRRAADVNVLNRVVQAHIRLGDRRLERVQIHDHQINRRDAVLFGGGLVRFIAADEKQAAVDFRVQRLHAAIQHFGKAGVFADVLHRETCVAQCLGRAAGGDDFNSSLCKNLGELNQPGFV